MVYSLQQLSSLKNPYADSFVNYWVDYYTWWFLQWYYLPMRVPEWHSEADKWVSQFTLNGIKSSNLCQPK